MHQKIINIVFIVIFMTALLVPIAFADFTGGAVSEDENRVKAELPSIGSIIRDPKLLGDWFNDNMGLRDEIIEVSKNIRTPGEQYSQGGLTFLNGKNDHIFFTGFSHEMINIFQGKNMMGDEQIKGFAGKLSEIRDYLDKRNAAFIVMLCTDKESIYPEF